MFYNIFGPTAVRYLKESKNSEETGNLHQK
jgi:hypothetical protein